MLAHRGPTVHAVMTPSVRFRSVWRARQIEQPEAMSAGAASAGVHAGQQDRHHLRASTGLGLHRRGVAVGHEASPHPDAPAPDRGSLCRPLRHPGGIKPDDARFGAVLIRRPNVRSSAPGTLHNSRLDSDEASRFPRLALPCGREDQGAARGARRPGRAVRRSSRSHPRSDAYRTSHARPVPRPAP